MKNIVKEVNCHDSLIIDTIRKMKELAGEGSFTAKQELHGVTVLVDGNSDVNLLFRDKQRAQFGYIEGPVGPHPKPELSAEDLANDDRIRVANRARYVKEIAERNVVQDA